MAYPQSEQDLHDPNKEERDKLTIKQAQQQTKEITEKAWDATTSTIGSAYESNVPSSVREQLKIHGSEALNQAAGAASQLQQWNMQRRDKNVIGVGPLDPLIYSGKAIDAAFNQVSKSTGIHRPWLDVADVLLPVTPSVVNLVRKGSKNLKQQLLRKSQIFNNILGDYNANSAIPRGHVPVNIPVIGQRRLTPDGYPIDEITESAIAMDRARKANLSNFLGSETVTEFTKSKTLIIKGKEIDVPITPYSLEELKEKVEKLIEVREALGIKNPRKGWQGLFGNYIGEDGWPIDFGGGRATSSRPLYVRSTKNANERFIKENLWPTNQANLKARRAWDKLISHKHHVRHLSPSTMFTFVKDKTGSYVRRSKQQLDNVAKILKKKHGINLGDQDLNEIMQSRLAHLEDPVSSHRLSRGSTDSENRVVGELLDDGTDLTKIKTYDKGQKHGFSKEGLELLGNIKSDQDLADAIALFYEITDEAYQGSAALASNIVDAGILKDPITTKLLKQYGDNETKFLQALLKMPQWENDPRLLKRLYEKYQEHMTFKGQVQIKLKNLIDPRDPSMN